MPLRVLRFSGYLFVLYASLFAFFAYGVQVLEATEPIETEIDCGFVFVDGRYVATLEPGRYAF